MVAIEPSANIKRVENSFASSTLEASVPNLIQVLSQSFESFKTQGMTELLSEISPIEDFNNTRYELNFIGHEFREPKYSESECRELEKTYASALYVTAQLKIKQTLMLIHLQNLFEDDLINHSIFHLEISTLPINLKI